MRSSLFSTFGISKSMLGKEEKPIMFESLFDQIKYEDSFKKFSNVMSMKEAWEWIQNNSEIIPHVKVSEHKFLNKNEAMFNLGEGQLFVGSSYNWIFTTEKNFSKAVEKSIEYAKLIVQSSINSYYHMYKLMEWSKLGIYPNYR